MSSIVHANLLAISEHHSPRLHLLISVMGEISLSSRKEECLHRFISKTVVGQQLSMAAAQTIWSRLIELCESRKESIRELFISQNHELIRECGVSRSKIRAIISLSESFDNGDLSKEKIFKMDYTEMTESVTSIWGLGRWTADMVALFYVGYQDIWAESDAALIRGVKILSDDPSLKSADFAETYAPFRSYLAQYIWGGLDAGLLK